jgi:sodium-dependent phosphate cotransporter
MSSNTLGRLPTPVKVLLVATTLYLFLVGIGAMSASFKLMGKDYTEQLLGSHAGPLVSLFIGILATTLVQSSSTTTSIVVGMVAAGVIPFHSAVYMVMGANVGTTVTNTIVSIGHITRTAEYERAFAAATVHDFFNLLVLLVLFPLEVKTGVLDWMAGNASDLFVGAGGTKLADPIKAATKPTISLLRDAAESLAGGAAGVVLLVFAILLTFGMIFSLVKLLKSIMVARVENLFDRVLFRSAYSSLVFGLLLTVFVQSSSITTSLAIPLVGAGVLTISQVMPYTMGANIGTTMTALMASLAALAAAEAGEHETALLGLRLAFHHVLFNVAGVAMMWKLRWLPIRIAEGFALLTLWNRLIPLIYIAFTFYLLPLLIILIGR